MVEDVHTERLQVTVFRFLHMLPCCKYSKDFVYTKKIIQMFQNTMLKRPLTRDRFLYASHKTYTGLVSW